MLPIVIGLAGKKRHGKDTLGQRFVQHWGYTRRSFAQILKDTAYAIDPIIETFPYDDGVTRLQELVDLHGWEKTKDLYPEAVTFLQRLGTDGVRNHLGEDTWVRAAMAQRERDEASVFTDVRFPNEVAAIANAGGMVLRVVRPGFIADPELDKHVSEHALDDLELPIVVNDGSIPDLEAEALRVIQQTLESVRVLHG